MKRILVFGMTDNPGGVESFLMSYFREIDKNKIGFDFLCNNKTVAYEDEIIKLGGRVFKITARSENYKIYKSELEAFFKENAQSYDAIWVNVCSLANIDYLKMAKKYGIKRRIIHSHNSQNMDSFARGLLHKFNRMFIKNYATDFWACSYAAASFFYSDSVIEGEKYKEIVNAIDCDKFAFNKEARDRIRKELNLEDKFVLGNVGRLHSQKNQSFLLDVFKEVLKKRKDAVLLIVGQGPEEKMLKGKVKELKLTKSVKFLGVRDDISALFSAMDVFVFPSNYEGLGIVLIEAQASGLYCKASRFRIPEGAKLTELVDFISLDFGPRAWAERISKIDRNYERISRKDEITQKGFNIKTEAVKLTKFFED